jgi:hypothetical protein
MLMATKWKATNGYKQKGPTTRKNKISLKRQTQISTWRRYLANWLVFSTNFSSISAISWLKIFRTTIFSDMYKINTNILPCSFRPSRLIFRHYTNLNTILPCSFRPSRLISRLYTNLNTILPCYFRPSHVKRTKYPWKDRHKSQHGEDI